MLDYGHVTCFGIKSGEVEMYQVSPIVTPCTLRDFCHKETLHPTYGIIASD